MLIPLGSKDRLMQIILFKSDIAMSMKKEKGMMCEKGTKKVARKEIMHKIIKSLHTVTIHSVSIDTDDILSQNFLSAVTHFISV